MTILTVVCEGRPGDRHPQRLLRRLRDDRNAGRDPFLFPWHSLFTALPTGQRSNNSVVGWRKGKEADDLTEESIARGRHRFVCPTCGRDRPLTDESLGRVVDALGVSAPMLNIGALR